MDNAFLLLCAGLILFVTFQAGRWYQKFKAALRMVKFVHDDAAWEADCKECRELVWEIRGYLQMIPWWRS